MTTARRATAAQTFASRTGAPRARTTLPTVLSREVVSLSGTCIVKRGTRYAVMAYGGVDPITHKKRWRWFGGFTSRKEAEQFRLVLGHSPAAIAGGTSRVRVDDYLDAWITHRAALRAWRPATVETARLMVSYLSPTLGHLPLGRLSAAAIEGTYAHLLERLSASTVRRAAETLRTALADAARQGLILRNPACDVPPPTADAYEPTLPTAAQLQAYLDDAARTATPALYGVYTVLAATGLRLGEVLGLPESAVDVERGVLTVDRQLRRAGRDPQFGRPKTRSGYRVIVLSDLALAAIRAALAWKREQRLRRGPAFRDAGLLFCGRDGRPLNPSNIRNRDHYPRLERLRLPRIRLHDLRHWNATSLDEAGISDAVLAARMGHSTARFTRQRYVHPRLEAQRQAAQVIDALLRPRGRPASTLQVLPADSGD